MPPASNRPIIKILIVDHNNHGLIARRSVLEEQGHLIASSASAEEALELCAREEFHIVITDFKMPKMNGVELIRRIRELKPGLPVILLSGLTDTLGLDEENTGADAVIQKSASEVPHLIRAVNRLTRPPKKPVGRQPPTPSKGGKKRGG